MGENKRKRGRKPKNSATETLDFPTTSTVPNNNNPSTMDDVFSVGNVELIDAKTSNRHRHLRGRPKKSTNNSDKPDKPPVISTARRVARPFNNDGDFTVPADVGGSMTVAVAMETDSMWESVSARVVPAMDSVVKVFCVHTEPNFSLPWQRKRQYSSSSSGFVIGGRRVLTNAHSVEHYTQVKLKKRGSDTKYLATVLAIGTECDIGINFSVGICI